MIDISATGHDLQDEFLNLIRASQETMVDALQAWTSAVQAVTPSVFKVDVPYADWLPKPGTLVNGVYDLAEQLLATQRKFANDVFRATAPLTGQGAAG
jgi:hypothetical protein